MNLQFCWVCNFWQNTHKLIMKPEHLLLVIRWSFRPKKSNAFPCAWLNIIYVYAWWYIIYARWYMHMIYARWYMTDIWSIKNNISHSIETPINRYVRTIKTQISAFWSKSLLSAWRSFVSVAISWAYSEDWSDIAASPWIKKQWSGTDTIEFHTLPQTPNRKGTRTNFTVWCFDYSWALPFHLLFRVLVKMLNRGQVHEDKQ